MSKTNLSLPVRRIETGINRMSRLISDREKKKNPRLVKKLELIRKRISAFCQLFSLPQAKLAGAL